MSQQPEDYSALKEAFRDLEAAVVGLGQSNARGSTPPPDPAASTSPPTPTASTVSQVNNAQKILEQISSAASLTEEQALDLRRISGAVLTEMQSSSTRAMPGHIQITVAGTGNVTWE